MHVQDKKKCASGVQTCMAVCVSLSVHARVRASEHACIGAYMRLLFYMVVAVFFLLKKQH